MKRHVLPAIVTAAALLLASSIAAAGTVGLPVLIEFDTSLQSLNLTGGPFPMPLASDPANALGDSVDGYGFVDSEIAITLSSQRATNPGPESLGQATAFVEGPAATAAFGEPLDSAPIDPAALDGQIFFVDSFFDVFFDITVTDVDSRAGRDFAGQPDGASLQLLDNGPASLRSFYQAVFDKDAPNFGLVPPPESDPYIGHFNIEIPLGGDINGNGIDDKIKFTLASHSVGDENRQFVTLPDGTVLDTFDSAAFLEGAIVDETSDPPFTIGGQLPNGLPDPLVFGGPTTATSQLRTPVIPEPSSCLLVVIGIVGIAMARRRDPLR